MRIFLERPEAYFRLCERKDGSLLVTGISRISGESKQWATTGKAADLAKFMLEKNPVWKVVEVLD